MIELLQVANLLKENDNYYILTHQYPDGDTLGSGFALCHALQALNKKAAVLVSGRLPTKYNYMTNGLNTAPFNPECIVAVDIADEMLLGQDCTAYAGKSFLCIDHHRSNRKYANYNYIDSSAAAAAEIIYQLIQLLGIKINKPIANCIYTGISTDTGCFKYSNVTPRTLRIAADLLELGCDASKINRAMFETKSKQRLQIEKSVLNTLKYYGNGRIAAIFITKALIESAGAQDDDMDGLASIPRQIEGVKIGITLREKDNNEFKISIRTTNEINASDLCEKFGGGGHPSAAGCAITGSITDVINKIVAEAEKALALYDTNAKKDSDL